MDPRLRAVCDLSIPSVREWAGLHEYDGQLRDLSPAGVTRSLAALGGPALPDPHDEAHLAAFESGLRIWYGEQAMHRRNPLEHIGELDVAGYDRTYAPEAERRAARRRHLAAWPDAVDTAVGALDAVTAPVAGGLLGPARGLAAGLRGDDEVEAAAVAAAARLVGHLERCVETGDPDPALGETGLAAVLGGFEAMPVDLGALARQADAERDRMRALLDDACARLAPGVPTAATVADLLADHPSADGVLAEARAVTAESIAFSRERGLAPYVDGECLVGPAPESRSWAMAMMSWSAPEEPDAPSWYHVTPPDPSWPAAEQEEWLAVFSRASLPAITVHEVAPGHFAHARALRHCATPVRRILHSTAFAEGWAHYGEELCLEEGFRGSDPRFAAGVALEALVRVTRLACSIGVHTRAMSMAEAAQRFSADAFLQGPAARSEAVRGTFDPTYGRYTWGKLVLLDLRARARAEWGSAYSHPRFGAALLALGSPPLGLVDTALRGG